MPKKCVQTHFPRKTEPALEDRHITYLEALRARHDFDRDQLRRALAGRQPQVLWAIECRQRAIEEETARILKGVRGSAA